MGEYADALMNILRSQRDVGVGFGENALALGTGMGAQVAGGLHGISDLVRGRGVEKAAKSAQDTSERFTYEPRSDVGKRGLQNIGTAIETATKPVMENVVDPIGERSPALGAAILGGAALIGPKGAKAKVRAPHTPRFDPGSVQQLIPGIEPLSLDQAHARARGELMRAQDAMSFDDPNRALRFEYEPNWRGGGPHYEMDFREGPKSDEGLHTYLGKRPVGRITQRPIPIAALEEPSSRTIPQGEFASGGTVQAEVGAENFQRMMALRDKLRAAEGEAQARGEEATMTRARALNEGIGRRRALLKEPDINAEQRLGLEEEILNKMRRRPMDVGGGRILEPTPGEGQFSNITWQDLLGNNAQEQAQAYLREHPGRLDAQTRIVRRLRGEPETTYEPRRPAPDRASLSDVMGRDPNAMSRESVNAFLTGGRSNPELFQYGVMPGPEVRSLDDFARHFGEVSNEPIDVSWSHADSDEPSKIKTEKTHGRGEVMRDRYGDYKLAEAEEGQVKYDDRGNPVTKEVEIAGPLEEGDRGPLVKEVEKTVPEGDAYMDEDGNYVYRKSEGGEPMRDERGHVKEEWQDNPDYTNSEFDEAQLSSPHGHIDIRYDDPAYISATEAGKKGGQLLYQTALAHASRAGIDIGGGSLTDINAYRLLSNVLSNIARTGKNPRDVAGTSSGMAERARGQAKGPEVWRAEAEEGRSRLLAVGADPDRLQFDPEKGFTLDGKPASPDDVKMNLGELSPSMARRGSYGGVGQKSLMRNAVFQWLRNATPEDAQRVAAKWPKEWGPIFAGVGALGVGVGALQQEPQTTE